MERLTGYMGSTPLTHPLSFQILDMNTDPGNIERTLILLNLLKARGYPSDPSCCCYGRSQTWRRPLAASSICVSLHHTIGRSKRGGNNKDKQAQYLTYDHPKPHVSLTLSATSKSLNSSSSAITHHLHRQHRNSVAVSPRLDQSHPSSKSTQSPLLFYVRHSSKTRSFLKEKKPGQHGIRSNPCNDLDGNRTLQRVHPVPSTC